MGRHLCLRRSSNVSDLRFLISTLLIVSGAFPRRYALIRLHRSRVDTTPGPAGPRTRASSSRSQVQALPAPAPSQGPSVRRCPRRLPLSVAIVLTSSLSRSRAGCEQLPSPRTLCKCALCLSAILAEIGHRAGWCNGKTHPRRSDVSGAPSAHRAVDTGVYEFDSRTGGGDDYISCVGMRAGHGNGDPLRGD